MENIHTDVGVLGVKQCILADKVNRAHDCIFQLLVA